MSFREKYFSDYRAETTLHPNGKGYKVEYAINEDGISVAIFLLALILEVIVEILAFIFCFSKSKIGKEI